MIQVKEKGFLSKDVSYYILLPSRFGNVGVVWEGVEAGPRVGRVFLSSEQEAAERVLKTVFASAVRQTIPPIQVLGEKIQSFLEGDAVEFDLDLIALDRCSAFQKAVLLAEYQIPRGWISTYGRIARHLGMPGAARAVGNALSRNPFPILIPCHRANQANGKVGGFQGGPEMKRALLEFEGIRFSSAGKILAPRYYY